MSNQKRRSRAAHKRRLAGRAEKRAPDPASSYERAKPAKEAGMGRLDNDPGTPTNRPDWPQKAVRNAHASRRLNSEDVVDGRAAEPLEGPGLENPLLDLPEVKNPLLDGRQARPDPTAPEDRLDQEHEQEDDEA